MRSLSSIAVIFLLAIGAARADLGQLDAAARPNTRVGAGYVIALNVSVRGQEEREMCRTFPLDGASRIQLTVGQRLMEPFSLKGLTCAEIQQRIASKIRRYFAGELEVRVGIARIPRFQVLVEGATLRSGIVSLPDGARLSDLLAETSYLPNSDLSRVRVMRVENGNRNQMVADFQRVLDGGAASDDRFNDPFLLNGDVIAVDTAIVIQPAKTIAVLGEVKRPGTLSYKPGLAVRDAIRDAFGLLPTAERERITVRRLQGDQVMTVNFDRAEKDAPTDNLKLSPDDTIFVNTHDSGLRYCVIGSVVAPQTFSYKGAVTLTQAITDAGGFRPEADRANIILAQNMLNDPSRARQIVISYDKIRKGEQTDIALQPGDLIEVPQKKKNKLNMLDIGIMLLRTFLF
jgi:protein involved in polysaccharide export with SLBB domain